MPGVVYFSIQVTQLTHDTINADVEHARTHNHSLIETN